MHIRFRLRTLFLGIAILSIPLAWYRLEWVNYSREFGAAQTLKTQFGVLIEGSDLGEELPAWSPSRFYVGRLYEPVRGVQIVDVQNDLETVLELVSEFRSIRNLVIADSPVTDRHLEYLKGISLLEDLTICNARVSGKFPGNIIPFRHLRTVKLYGNPLDNNAISWLSKSPKLEDVWLSDTPVTDVGLAHLAKTSSLITLQLARTKISDQGLASLPQMSSLDWLDLGSTRISSQGLTSLQINALTIVRLDYTLIDDTALKWLGKHRNLNDVSLAGTCITDDGMKHLGALVNLEYLSLKDTSISDTGLSHLTSLSKLRSVDLSETDVTDNCINHLRKISSLKHVWLSGPRLTTPGKKRLVIEMPQVSFVGVAPHKKSIHEDGQDEGNPKNQNGGR